MHNFDPAIPFPGIHFKKGTKQVSKNKDAHVINYYSEKLETTWSSNKWEFVITVHTQLILHGHFNQQCKDLYSHVLWYL